MRVTGSGAGRGLRLFSAIAGAVVAAAILASCSTTGDSTSATMSGSGAAATTTADPAAAAPVTTTDTTAAPTTAAPAPVAVATTTDTKPRWSLFGGKGNKANRGLVTVQSDDTYSPDLFIAQGYCPPVQIRPGTEALTVYEKGHQDDPTYIRFQASLGQMARECHSLGNDQLSIKVGITGRITAGPKGGPGAVTANLRVVVVKQQNNSVFFTQAFKVGATVAAPNFDGDFSQVVDNIVLKLGPTDRDLIIYIGFDEGKPKPPPATG
jgi:hypothetical protein